MFGTQLKNELLKLFARKRTYIGFGAFVVVQCLLVATLLVSRSRREGAASAPVGWLWTALPFVLVTLVALPARLDATTVACQLLTKLVLSGMVTVTLKFTIPLVAGIVFVTLKP